jgi:hypothetical protein
LNQAGSLWRYRWHNRRLGPFIARYQRFYSREHRYVRWPDNRACARQVFPLKELRMGENEEEYLYQGWYNRERWHDEWIRWATPVASLRVAFPQPVHQLEARLILHPALDSLQLTLSAYRWGEPKVEAQCSCLVEQRRQTLMERPPQVRSDQVVSATARRIAPLPTPGTSGMVDLTIPLELPAGEFLLVWQTSEHLTEDGFVPRVIGLGLSELRSG